VSLPPIFTVLAATPAVTAIIGTNPVRCYPAGSIPQVSGLDPNSNLPCVTWQSIGGMPENMLGERPVVDNLRTQIDCWSTSFGGADALSSAVQIALEIHGYVVGINGHDYDDTTKRYRASFDWSWWVTH
jgi:hypothetical protein